jgi:hypothetical protein
VLWFLKFRIIVQPHYSACALLKHNIETLLKARGQTRASLARACGCSRSWLDKAFSSPEREIPSKYYDVIANYFGISVYQLFSLGIDPLTERRSHTRRRGHERRISAASAGEQPRSVVDVMDMLRLMSEPGRRRAMAFCADIVNDEMQEFRRQREQTADTPASMHALKRKNGGAQRE